MYSKMFEGKKIRISSRHRKLLLKRFDANNFVRVDGVVGKIEQQRLNRTPCVLCESFYTENKFGYGGDCGNCPFEVFRRHDFVGCARAMYILIPNRAISMCRSSIKYSAYDGAQPLEDLKKITDFLKSFKKE